MLKLRYQIVTPERVVMEGEADSLTAMTTSGEVTVLPKHVALVTLLRAGEMRVKNDGVETSIAASSGMLEVREGSEVVVLAETAERSEELELAAIETAKKRATDALANIRNRNDVAFADAAAHLERELARYRVAVKHRRKSNVERQP